MIIINEFKFIVNNTKIVYTIDNLEQLINNIDVHMVVFKYDNNYFLGNMLLDNTDGKIIEHDINEFNKSRSELKLPIVDNFKNMILLQIKEIIDLDYKQYNDLWNELFKR